MHTPYQHDHEGKRVTSKAHWCLFASTNRLQVPVPRRWQSLSQARLPRSCHTEGHWHRNGQHRISRSGRDGATVSSGCGSCHHAIAKCNVVNRTLYLIYFDFSPSSHTHTHAHTHTHTHTHTHIHRHTQKIQVTFLCVHACRHSVTPFSVFTHTHNFFRNCCCAQDVSEHGHFRGVPSPGFLWTSLENVVLRKRHSLDPDTNEGVLVTGIQTYVTCLLFYLCFVL